MKVSALNILLRQKRGAAIKKNSLHKARKEHVHTDLLDGNFRITRPDTDPKTHPMTMPTGPWSNCWVKFPVENAIPRRTPNRNIEMTSLQLVTA